YTPRVKKSLYFAAREAKVCKNAPVGAEHILLGLVLEGDGVAGRVLRDFGLSPETTREEIMRGGGRNREGRPPNQAVASNDKMGLERAAVGMNACRECRGPVDHWHFQTHPEADA